MTQSYKVFIGGSVLTITDLERNHSEFDFYLVEPDPENWMGIILSAEEDNSTYLIIGNAEKNWQNFCAHFKLVEAAGGLVQNEDGYWLFIYRNGMWDLPKGKLEKGESIEECAVREVAEECGIDEPTIVRQLSTTYHTYTLKEKRVLKPTYWYLMKSEDVSELIPQTEEGITEVKWVSTEKAVELAKDSFGSIKEVVGEGLNK